MTGNIGQRFLQNMKYLAFLFRSKAQIGEPVFIVQRDAGAFLKAKGEPLQCMLQAHRIQAAAKLHQQLAQVAVGIVERLTDIAGVSRGALRRLVGNGVVEHRHAHQGLCQGIVNLGRHHLAFAGQYDAQVFALEPRVLQRHAQVLTDRAEQQCHFFGQLERLRQEQVVGAQQSPGILQRHHHHGLATGLEKVASGALVASLQVDLEQGAVLADGNSALATVARDEAFLFHYLRRQATRRNHAQMQAVTGQHPYHAGVCLGQTNHGSQESAEQFVEVVLIGESAGNLGEDMQRFQRVTAGWIEIQILAGNFAVHLVHVIHSGTDHAPESILSAHIRAAMLLPSVISPSRTARTASATFISMTSRNSP